MSNWKPERKIVAAGGIGAPVAILVAWILQLNGITMPAEAAAALGSVLSTVVAYLVPR